jgi:oxygen-independent coproporphyrinogen-3 oxidase
MLRREDGSAVRFANAEELVEYEGRDGGQVMGIGEKEAFEECVFLGLRLNEGLDVSALRERFAGEWVHECEERVLELAREGLMWVEDGRWGLTLRGRLVSSEVFGELLAVAV